MYKFLFKSNSADAILLPVHAGPSPSEMAFFAKYRRNRRFKKIPIYEFFDLIGFSESHTSLTGSISSLYEKFFV